MPNLRSYCVRKKIKNDTKVKKSKSYILNKTSGMKSSVEVAQKNMDEKHDRKLPILTLDLLSSKLGVKCKKLLGKGRSSEVYDVLSSFDVLAGKLWKIRANGNQSLEMLANREMQIARWAASKGIGPEIEGMRSTFVDMQYEPIVLVMMLMEKMHSNLSTFTKLCSLPELEIVWRMVFDHLACDYTIQTTLWSGWLCCDDLKPENILINYTSNKKRHTVRNVKFIDWDSRHCYILPLSNEYGIFLNRLILMFNSIIRIPKFGSTRISPQPCMITSWPPYIQQILFEIVKLSQDFDTDFIEFLTSLDEVFKKGPYYYAGVFILKTPYERATNFAKICKDVFNDIYCSEYISAMSDVIDVKAILKEITGIMNDIRSSRSCATSGQIIQNPLRKCEL